MRRKLLQLTVRARSTPRMSLMLDIERESRGGAVHRFWQHRIQEAFEQEGYDASLNKERPMFRLRWTGFGWQSILR
jgi:hypothetical protein